MSRVSAFLGIFKNLQEFLRSFKELIGIFRSISISIISRISAIFIYRNY
jgi:hypothetical protein